MTKQELKLKAHKIIENKWVALASLIIGFVYITVYGFLKFPDVKITASMLGLIYPVAFKFWGLISLLAFAININYMYARYDVKPKLGYVGMLVGSVAIMICVHIPSTEIMSLQLVAHWSCALIFAVAFAFSILWGLIVGRKKTKAFMYTVYGFGAVLLLMIILLASLGKSGIIESIPTWGAYVILFLTNFTNIYEKQIAKEKAAVEYNIGAKGDNVATAEANATAGEEQTECAAADVTAISDSDAGDKAEQ